MSLDNLDAALADSRRRCTLATLRGERGPLALEELARAVAAREADVPEAEVSIEARHRVAISLHHAHLPKLAALDLVAYDPDRKLVGEGAAVPEVLGLLDRLQENAPVARTTRRPRADSPLELTARDVEIRLDCTDCPFETTVDRREASPTNVIDEHVRETGDTLSISPLEP